MLSRWQGAVATVLTVVTTIALVVLDFTDEQLRRWWAGHTFTTSTMAGLLVLAVTVLVVNQVLHGRQVKDRAQATAAQAAIVLNQASRATKAVSAALGGSGDRGTASDETRTYLTMLLIAAPVFIDASVPRHFLEQAQQLAADLAHTLARPTSGSPGQATPTSAINRSLENLRNASTPLLLALDPAQRTATRAPDDVTAPSPTAS